MPSSLASNEQQDIMLDTDDLEFDTENFENNAKKDLHSMWLSFILVTVVT